MNVIETENLSKTFRVRQKEKGMKGSLKAIFKPQIQKIQAVDRPPSASQDSSISLQLNFFPRVILTKPAPGMLHVAGRPVGATGYVTGKVQLHPALPQPDTSLGEARNSTSLFLSDHL